MGEEIGGDGDLYIVGVKDGVLGELGGVLVKGREEGLFVDRGGSMCMDLWKGLVKGYGVVYGMESFRKEGEVDLNSVGFFIEGCGGGEVELVGMVGVGVSGKVYEVSWGEGRYLDVGGVFGCNFGKDMYGLS